MVRRFPLINTRNVLWVIFGLSVATTAAYTSFRLSTLNVDRSAIAVRDNAEERRKIEHLETQSRDRWERYVSARDFRGKVGEKEIKILAEALQLREEYVKLNSKRGDPALLIESIRKEWQKHQAEECLKQSRKAQAMAEDAMLRKDYGAAAKAFEEALALEDKIADEYRLAQASNTARRALLNRRMRFARGFPIDQEGRKLEREGDTAMAEKQWDLAAEKYMAARANEEILNTNYSRLFATEFSRKAKLLAKHETARSSATHEEIQKIISTAMRLADTGQDAKAEALWDDAMERYRELQHAFPNSVHVNKETLLKLREQREKNLSAPFLSKLKREVDAIDASLRAGTGGDVSQASHRLLLESTRIQKKYPNILTVDQETHTKLQCLSVRGHAVPAVRRILTQALRPLPGAPALQLMKIEVSQELYSAVTGENESSAARRKDFPVDSVDYMDTLRFCKNLGWLTASLIRLPTRKEFLDAVGNTTTFQPSQAWSYENSGDGVHAVGTSQANAHGFHDLLGNLSEWVEEDNLVDPSLNTALEIGGSYQTSWRDLSTIPSAPVLKRDRSRLRGFRILQDNSKQ